jgi:hypothetical protein
MSKRLLSLSVAAGVAAGAALADTAFTAASAAPLYGEPAIGQAAGTEVVPVYYREWGWSYYGPAYDDVDDVEPRYYRRYYYHDVYDRSYGYAPRYRPAYRDDGDYCASRYRSWDPDTGTYLGYDGYRHPCP